MYNSEYRKQIIVYLITFEYHILISRKAKHPHKKRKTTKNTGT